MRVQLPVSKGEKVETDSVWERLETAQVEVSEVAELKEENDEPDIPVRAGLAMAGWRPDSPLDRTVEYWEYDMEYGVNPQHVGVKWNSKVEPRFSH